MIDKGSLAQRLCSYCTPQLHMLLACVQVTLLLCSGQEPSHVLSSACARSPLLGLKIYLTTESSPPTGRPLLALAEAGVCVFEWSYPSVYIFHIYIVLKY